MTTSRSNRHPAENAVFFVAMLLALLGAVSFGVRGTVAWYDWGLIGFTALVTAYGFTVNVRLARRQRLAAATLFESVADEALKTVAQSSEPAERSLEDEIADVSGTLTGAVTRLRAISTKAEAFEREVRELIDRAEAAQATASLNEHQARKIAHFLGRDTVERLSREIELLKEANTEESERQARSSRRLAWITFVGGVLLGVVGNVVTNMIMA